MKLGAVDYEFEINGTRVSELDPRSIDLTLISSIHRLTPRLEVSFNDPTGLYSESLLIEKLTPVKLKMNAQEVGINLDFVITDRKLNTPIDKTSIAGQWVLKLRHALEFEPPSSRSYKNRISEVVKQLFPEFSNNLNDTGNDDHWVQSAMTRKEFIEELVKYSWSSNAEGTPWYTFLSLTGEINLRNLKSLETSGEELEATLETNNDLSPFRVLSYRIINDITEEQYRAFSVKSVSVDSEKDKGLRTILPSDEFMLHNKTATQSPTDFSFSLGLLDNVDNSKGDDINEFSKHVFSDRMILTFPFNIQLRAGARMTLTARTSGEDSYRWSGSYVIEWSQHTLSGTENSSFTRVIVGRRGVKLSNSYAYRGFFTHV